MEYEIKVISWERKDEETRMSKCRLTQAKRRIAHLVVGWAVLTVNDELVALWDGRSPVWLRPALASLPSIMEAIREAEARLNQ